MNGILDEAKKLFEAKKAELDLLPRNGPAQKYTALKAVAAENDLARLVLIIFAALAVSPILIKMFLSNGGDYLLALEREQQAKQSIEQEALRLGREANRQALLKQHKQVEEDLTSFRADYERQKGEDEARITLLRDAPDADEKAIKALERELEMQRAFLLVYPEVRSRVRRIRTRT